MIYTLLVYTTTPGVYYAFRVDTTEGGSWATTDQRILDVVPFDGERHVFPLEHVARVHIIDGDHVEDLLHDGVPDDGGVFRPGGAGT